MQDPDPGDTITKYKWTQLGGPAVIINNPTSSIAGFTAPLVTQPTTLEFRLEYKIDFNNQILPMLLLPSNHYVVVEQINLVILSRILIIIRKQQQLQILQSSNQCNPNIKVKGNIYLETPSFDRSDLSLPNLRVQLCSSLNTCDATTFTDSNGNFEISSNKISKTDAKLKVRFDNRDQTFSIADLDSVLTLKGYLQF